MRDPLYRLKLLPWRSLFLAAGLTALLVLSLEFVIVLAAMQLSVVAGLFRILFSPSLNILTILAAAIGIGALAVFILERGNCPSMNASTLWALVLCLAIVFALRSLLPIPAVLLQFGYVQLVGLVLGVFFKGRPHWQSFRRW